MPQFNSADRLHGVPFGSAVIPVNPTDRTGGGMHKNGANGTNGYISTPTYGAPDPYQHYDVTALTENVPYFFRLAAINRSESQ